MEQQPVPTVRKGVWPVMLTPFTDDGEIDLHGLRSLVGFYIENGANGLFANCLSSEVQELSPDEILLLCRKTIEYADGRVPVATGMPDGTIQELADFAKRVADEGADSVVISTNQIAQENNSESIWKRAMETLMGLTGNIPLGTYECPVPYKRILSPDLFRWVAQSGRINFHKDTCSDAGQIRKKLAGSKNTPLRFFNANLPTLLDSLLAGGDGYSGVDTNFFPELCVWICENHRTAPENLVHETESFLKKSLDMYKDFYPLSSKLFLQMRGVEMATRCRRKMPRHTPTDLRKLQSLHRDHKQYSEKLLAADSMCAG